MRNWKIRTHFQILGALLAAFTGCRPAQDEQRYEIRGEVISIYSLNNEITIKHEEIPGFMPAMTMPFKVRDVRMLEGLKPGDLVSGTFVVATNGSYLSSLGSEGSGRSDLPDIELPSGVRLIRKGDQVPDMAFLDENNEPRKLSDFLGKPVALTFIYTRCPVPNFCPLMDQNFAEVQATIKKGVRLKRDCRLLSITFDPDYDTPEVLRRHAQKREADPNIWRFLTGESEAIVRFGEQFGITVVRDGEGAPEITHSLRTVVLDREGKVTKNIRGNEWTPDQLIEELGRL